MPLEISLQPFFNFQPENLVLCICSTGRFLETEQFPPPTGGNELNRLSVTSPALEAFGKRFFHGTTFHLHFLTHQCLLFIYIKSPALHPFD
jgi:hypothetical protein